MKTFKVTFSNTSRNSVHGLKVRTTTMSEKDIISAANAECIRVGKSLQELAGIQWVEKVDGNFKPAREWSEGEELATAVEKLGDDGRMFEIEAE